MPVSTTMCCLMLRRRSRAVSGFACDVMNAGRPSVLPNHAIAVSTAVVRPEQAVVAAIGQDDIRQITGGIWTSAGSGVTVPMPSPIVHPAPAAGEHRLAAA